MVSALRETLYLSTAQHGGVRLTVATDSIDRKLEAFLWRNFPVESREKDRANLTEAGKEIYGQDYEYSSVCVLM